MPGNFRWSGHSNWEFYQFSQLGADGFFGPFDQDSSTVGGTVNLGCSQRMAGHEITGDNLASGSDAVANYIYATIYPKVKVNEAFLLRGATESEVGEPISRRIARPVKLFQVPSIRKPTEEIGHFHLDIGTLCSSRLSFPGEL